MRVYPECCPCMLERVLLFCRNEEGKKKYRAMREICKLFSEEFSSEKTTAELAYKRNKIIGDIIENRDPLRELKEKSLFRAKKIYPRLKDYVSGIKESQEKFRKAVMIALAGNIVEFGAKDHEVDLSNLEEEIFKVVEEKPAIDEIEKVHERIKPAQEILYVTDNAGELIFDKIFIEELQKYAKVYLAPLSRPCQDDATVEDVKKAEIKAEIIPRSDFIGVWFPRCNKKFIKKWEEVDFIIAKGMACYETLTEYPERTQGKVALLFKAKCSPVARDIGVKLGETVVKIL